MNKLSEFNLFLDCHNPDVIALTETWLSDNVPNSLITCSKLYSIYRHDRVSKRGGGVCLIIKENSKMCIQPVSLPSKFDCLEILAVDFNDCSGALPFRFVVAYRPPDYSSCDNDLFFSALDYLANNCGRFCLTGDLNLPDFEWELFLHPDNGLYNAAANLVCSHGLIQLVNEPTREDNILDIVLCSDILSCDNIKCLAPLGSSDHNIVSFTLALSLPVVGDDETSQFRSNFIHADWSSLLHCLSAVNWTHEFSSCASADDMWSKFMEVVNSAISQNVPNYKSSASSHAYRYYPARIRKLYANKLRCWKLFKTFRTEELLAKYKRVSKACSSSVKYFQNRIEDNLVNSGNLGSFYRYVNS